MDDMPAKKVEEGLPAWVMTFADLMSLLMCFFILLLAFSEMDVEKFKQLAGSMREAFGVQREIKVKEPPKGVNIIATEFSAGRPDPTPLNVVKQNTTNVLKQHLDMSKSRVKISREGKGEMMNQGSLQGDQKQYALKKLEDILAHKKQKAEEELIKAHKELEKAKLELEDAPFYYKMGAQDKLDDVNDDIDEAQKNLEAIAKQLANAEERLDMPQSEMDTEDTLRQIEAIQEQAQELAEKSLEENKKALEEIKDVLDNTPFYDKADVQVLVDEAQEKMDEAQAKTDEMQAELADTRARLTGPTADEQRYVLDKLEDIQAFENMKRVQENVEDIREALKEEIESGAVEVETDELKIIIRIKEKASFPSASADLRDDFKPIITRVAAVLEKSRGKIIVAGHTDDIPINNQRFRSNWELSAARAVSVVHEILATSNLTPDRLLIEGYADTLPLVPNISWENRSKNRRVEIVLEQGQSSEAFIDEDSLIDTGMGDLIGGINE